MTVVTQKLRLSVSLLTTLIFASYCYDNLQEGKLWMAASASCATLAMSIVAFGFYRQRWEVHEENRIFTIRTNGRVRFQGRRIDLTIVTTDHGHYFLTPAKGRTVVVPKEAANKALLRLIGKDATSQKEST